MTGPLAYSRMPLPRSCTQRGGTSATGTQRRMGGPLPLTDSNANTVTPSRWCAGHWIEGQMQGEAAAATASNHLHPAN